MSGEYLFINTTFADTVQFLLVITFSQQIKYLLRKFSSSSRKSRISLIMDELVDVQNHSSSKEK